MALALGIRFFLFGDFFEERDFLVGLLRFPDMAVNLRKAVVGLVRNRHCFNSFLESADGCGIVFAFGAENAELEVGVAEIRIELDGDFQFRFGLWGMVCSVLLLQQSHGIQIMRSRIFWLKGGEALHLFGPCGGDGLFRYLQPA